MRWVPADVQALPFAAGAVCGAVAATCSGLPAAFAAVGAAVLVIVLCRSRRGVAVRCMAGFAAAVLSAFVLKAPSLPPSCFNGQERTVTARVLAVADTPGSQNVLAAAQIGGLERAVRVRFIVTDISAGLLPGHIFTAKVMLQPPGRLEDVSGLGLQELGQRADRAAATAIAAPEQIRIIDRADGLASRLDDLRQSMALAIYGSGLSAPAASLLASSLLGMRDTVPRFKEQFRATGLSHLLCVSGFHVAVLCGILSFVLRPLRLLRRGTAAECAILLIAVWFYAALTGLAPSALRAAIMLSCFIAARLLQRDFSPLNSLGVAVGIMLIVNPWWIYSPGFQLSVCAVAGLLVFAGKLNPIPVRHLSYRRLFDLVSIPLAASLATAPVLLALFHRLPLMSLPVNAFAAILFPVFMFAGLVHLVLCSLGLNLGFLAAFLDWTGDTLERLCSLFSGYELTGIYLTPSATIALAAAIVLLAAVLHLRHRRHKSLAAAAMACMLVLAACTNTPLPTSQAVIDLHGHGQSVCIARGTRGAIYSTGRGHDVLERYERFFAAHGIAADSIDLLPMPPDRRIPGLPPIPKNLVLPRPLVCAY